MPGDSPLQALPAASRMRWCRVDGKGQEEARIDRAATGWRLTGRLDVEEQAVKAQLRYVVECDPEWRTRSVVVEGRTNGGPIRFELAADGEGRWRNAVAPLPELDGAFDVDFGFTPATNSLPIRRLRLAIGASALVRSAWLRFPELRLEPLEQVYAREAEDRYRYEAVVDGEPFTATLDVDAFGSVIRYEGLWEATAPTDRGMNRGPARRSTAREWAHGVLVAAPILGLVVVGRETAGWLSVLAYGLAFVLFVALVVYGIVCEVRGWPAIEDPDD